MPRASVGPATTRPAKVITVASTVHQRWSPTTAQAARAARPAPMRTQPAIVRRAPDGAAAPARRRAVPPSERPGSPPTRAAIGGHHGDEHPDGQGEQRPSASRWPVRCVGISTPISFSSDADARGQPDAEHQTQTPPDTSPIECRPRRGPRQHLTAGRPDRAQQRDLAPALRDQHVEGVPDDEGADQHRDAGEHQQHGREDAHRVAHGGGAVGGHLVPGQRLDPVGEHRRDAVAELAGAHAVLGLHVDLVDHALPCRAAAGRSGRSNPAMVAPSRLSVSPKPMIADQREGLPAVLEHHVDRSPSW